MSGSRSEFVARVAKQAAEIWDEYGDAWDVDDLLCMLGSRLNDVPDIDIDDLVETDGGRWRVIKVDSVRGTDGTGQLVLNATLVDDDVQPKPRRIDDDYLWWDGRKYEYRVQYCDDETDDIETRVMTINAWGSFPK